MGFTKLDSGIVNSSIWSEPLATRVLWITMLAMSDENGFVSSSRPGLQRISNIPLEDFDSSLSTLEKPDPESRTPDYEGRRVVKIEGGWVVVNFEKYRSKSEIIKEQTRERVKKFREKVKKDNVTHCNVTVTLPSASASASEGEKEEGMQGESGGICPTASEVAPFAGAWIETSNYTCRRDGKRVKARLYGKHVLLTEAEHERMVIEWGEKFTSSAISEYDNRFPNSKAIRGHTDHNLAIRDYVNRGYICKNETPLPPQPKATAESKPSAEEIGTPEERSEIARRINPFRRSGTGPQSIRKIMSDMGN